MLHGKGWLSFHQTGADSGHSHWKCFCHGFKRHKHWLSGGWERVLEQEGTCLGFLFLRWLLSYGPIFLCPYGAPVVKVASLNESTCDLLYHIFGTTAIDNNLIHHKHRAHWWWWWWPLGRQNYQTQHSTGLNLHHKHFPTNHSTSSCHCNGLHLMYQHPTPGKQPQVPQNLVLSKSFTNIGNFSRVVLHTEQSLTKLWMMYVYILYFKIQ